VGGAAHHASLLRWHTAQVWGILRAGEPARQFVEGGEYYVLKEVPYVAKVGDVLEQIEAQQTASLAK
jgi:hypothetical protein